MAILTKDEIIQEYYKNNPSLLIEEELIDFGYDPKKFSKSVEIVKDSEYEKFLIENQKAILLEEKLVLEEDAKLSKRDLQDAMQAGKILPKENRLEILKKIGTPFFAQNNPNKILEQDLTSMAPDAVPGQTQILSAKEIEVNAEKAYFESKLSSFENKDQEWQEIIDFSLERIQDKSEFLSIAVENILKKHPKDPKLKEQITEYLVDISNKSTAPFAFNERVKIDEVIKNNKLSTDKLTYNYKAIKPEERKKLIEISDFLNNKETTAEILYGNSSEATLIKLCELRSKLDDKNIIAEKIDALIAHGGAEYLTKQAELGNIDTINRVSDVLYKTKAFIEYGNFTSLSEAKERYASITANKLMKDEANIVQNINDFLDKKPSLGDEFEKPNKLLDKLTDIGLANAENNPEILIKTIELVKEQNPNDNGVDPINRVFQVLEKKFPDNKEIDQIFNQGDTEKLKDFIIKNKLINEVREAINEPDLNKDNLYDKLSSSAEKNSLTSILGKKIIERAATTENPIIQDELNYIISNQLKEHLSIGSEAEITELYNKSIKSGNQNLADLILLSNQDLSIAKEIQNNLTQESLNEKEPAQKEKPEQDQSTQKQPSLLKRGVHKVTKRFGAAVGIEVASLKDQQIDERSVLERIQGATHKASKVLNASYNFAGEKIRRTTHSFSKGVNKRFNKIKDAIYPKILDQEFEALLQEQKTKETKKPENFLKRLANKIKPEPKPEIKIPTAVSLTEKYFEEIVKVAAKHSDISDTDKRKKAIGKDLENYLDSVIKGSETRIKERNEKMAGKAVGEWIDNVKGSETLSELGSNLVSLDGDKLLGTNRSSARKHDQEVIDSAKIFKENLSEMVTGIEIDLVNKLRFIKPNLNKEEERKKILEDNIFIESARTIKDKRDQIYTVEDTGWKKAAEIFSFIPPLKRWCERKNSELKDKEKKVRIADFNSKVTEIYKRLSIDRTSAEKLTLCASSQSLTEERTLSERLDGALHYVVKNTIGSDVSIDPRKKLKYTTEEDKGGHRSPPFTPKNPEHHKRSTKGIVK